MPNDAALEDTPTRPPLIEKLAADIESWGECHAVIEETDAEVELRQGTATFEDESQCITVENGQTLMRIGYDRVVSWYLPTEFYHE